MCRRICAPPELNIRIYDPLKIPLPYEVNNEKFNAMFLFRQLYCAGGSVLSSRELK